MNFLPTTASPTILIVDDQPSNLKILTKIIVSVGWQVRIAVAGQAAIAECRQQPPDLILLDVMLPDLNGFEVCRILKHLPTTQNIPILFMTALTNATDKVKGFQSGGVDYITKPFHSEDVLARLTVHWRIRQMEQILSLQNQQLQELNTQLKQQVSSRDNQLKVSQETLQRFLDNAHDLIQSISLSNGQFLFVNQAWLKILGYSFSDLKTLTIFDIIHPDYLSHYQTLFTQLKQGEITELNNLQICLMDKNGEWIYVEGNTKSYVGQDASITTWGIFRDITERHHIDAELRRSLQEKESLLKEVHHRVKNNLLIVSSLMDWKCELINDPACSTFFEDSQKRIQAMALIHEKLYRSHNLASINVGDYLLDLAQQLMAAHGNGLGDSALIDLDCQLDPIYLNLETATPCGLIVNELILNALNHGFPPGESGQVTLEFRDQGENGYLLVVQDNGRGLPQDFDPHTLNTLGWQLITLLTQQLDGQIAIVPTEGTRVELYFRELIYPARL